VSDQAEGRLEALEALEVKLAELSRRVVRLEALAQGGPQDPMHEAFLGYRARARAASERQRKEQS
jgi:hypothetical protein